MSLSQISNLFLLRPQVLHRIPGRIRIQLPLIANTSKFPELDIGDLCHNFCSSEGIESVNYNPSRRTLLIIYDTTILNEEEILATIKRFGTLITKSIPNFLAASEKTKTILPQRIMDFFINNPIDIRSTMALELPDDIWK